jgi:hypothetical protein
VERFYLEWRNKLIKSQREQVCETKGKLENKDANLIETAENCMRGWKHANNLDCE